MKNKQRHFVASPITDLELGLLQIPIDVGQNFDDVSDAFPFRFGEG
jgi:hypothetical protein